MNAPTPTRDVLSEPYTHFVRPTVQDRIEYVPQARLFDEQQVTPGSTPPDRPVVVRPRHRHGRRRHRRGRTVRRGSLLSHADAVGVGLLAVVALTVALGNGCLDSRTAVTGMSPIAADPATPAAPVSDPPSTPAAGVAPKSPAPGPSGEPAREPRSARGPLPPPHRASPQPRCPDSLSRGDVGPDVESLQHFLFRQGFTYVSATGVFDQATAEGVLQYQRDRGITGDPQGVFGPAPRASSGACSPAPAR
ncbi:peptidoglycan-binding domain-containing protein [Streptomyces sp. NPDC048664]|uniref:peptidoglycan-binding domain-containing protein n=1 Tax=Streptomyces sp. NPDC048664 TaxID=3154505 RepID=UPI003434A739